MEFAHIGCVNVETALLQHGRRFIITLGHHQSLFIQYNRVARKRVCIARVNLPIITVQSPFLCSQHISEIQTIIKSK